MSHKFSRGFALPSVLITAVIMMTVLLVGLSAVVSTRTGLESQFIYKLNKEAAESGLKVAMNCLEASDYVPQWTNAKPLRIDTDCTGTDLVGGIYPCTTASTDPKCYVTNQGNYRTDFFVYFDLDDDGNVKSINSVGNVKTVRKTSGAISKIQQQMTKLSFSDKLEQATQLNNFVGSGTQGFGDSTTGTSAQFYNPGKIAIGPNGNLYIADKENHRIRMVTPAGAVSTFAGSGTAGILNGTGTGTQFNGPLGMTIHIIDNVNAKLYVTEQGSDAIRMITIPGAVVSTVSATGFNDPGDVALDSTNSYLYIADFGNHVIKRLSVGGGTATIFAGINGSLGWADGPCTSAQFEKPIGLAVDPSNNTIYVAEFGNRIRKITTSGGVCTSVSTVAGSTTGALGSLDGNGTNAGFWLPSDIALDSKKNLLVTELYNQVIRKITPSGDVTKLITGLNQPAGLAIANNGKKIYFSETDPVDRVRTLDLVKSTDKGIEY